MTSSSSLVLALVNSLPVYNPSTRCHDLTLSDENLTFAICLQRAPNKQHPYNLYTSPAFCTTNYPPSGHLIDLSILSKSTISRLFDSLIALLNSRNSQIDYPEPNFLWISSSKNPFGTFVLQGMYRFQPESNRSIVVVSSILSNE